MMQGNKPCRYCPYDYKCERCPEDLAKEDPMAKYEKGGFYSKEVRIVKDADGKEKFDYSHPE